MRWLVVAPLVLLLTASTARAEDERYLLGDYGVRIDLPSDWQSLDWTDAAFEAETEDRSLKLFAWGTPGQVPLREADLDAWAQAHVDRLSALGGAEVEVRHQALARVGEREVARFELAATFGEGRRAVLSGVTIPVEGRTLHLAVFAAEQRAVLAAQAVELMLERAEVRRPAQALSTGGPIAGAGVTAQLPTGWRSPLAAELGEVAKLAGELGIEDLEACWTALRPEANDAPDVLITCGGGLRLGVVDAFSFPGVDAALRERLFGTVPVAPAEPLTVADGRPGFLYRPDVAGKSLRIAVVPYGDGIARTWAYGDEPDEGAAFDAVLTEVIAGATYEGEHPTGLGDQLAYWWTWRKSSPVVWGPLLGLVGLVGVAGASARGRRRTYEDDLD